MSKASALPIIGIACCNSGMLSGQDLAKAIVDAMEKRQQAGGEKYGPSALGRDLGISQPSASELLKTGRLAKDKYLLLVKAFSKFVGPDHWGLPYSKQEMDIILDLRELPEQMRHELGERLRAAAMKYRSEAASVLDSLMPTAAPTKTISTKAPKKVA